MKCSVPDERFAALLQWCSLFGSYSKFAISSPWVAGSLLGAGNGPGRITAPGARQAPLRALQREMLEEREFDGIQGAEPAESCPLL